MLESMDLFQSIINNKLFSATPIMLFLNKKDLFEAKIKLRPLRICFNEYDGENTYEATTSYIASKFDGLKNGPNLIYTHFTCATSTENISSVFNIVTNIILDRNLKTRG